MKNSLVAIIALVAFAVTGCGGVSSIKPDRTAPANLLQQCENLPKVDGKTIKDLIDNHIEVTTLYHICSGRHKALTDFETKQ